jgi:hypothetical protein
MSFDPQAPEVRDARSQVLVSRTLSRFCSPVGERLQIATP